jgi:Lar family restriction alleviation protein
MSEELKACPFCGKDAGVLQSGIVQNLKFEHYVKCSNCGCLGPNKRVEERVCDVWNTRPIEDALTARIDVLIRACKRAAECLYDNEEWLEYAFLVDTIAKCEVTK